MSKYRFNSSPDEILGLQVQIEKEADKVASSIDMGEKAYRFDRIIELYSTIFDAHERHVKHNSGKKYLKGK